MKNFPRITWDPAVMGGKACIRGMRVTAGMVVGLVAAGRSPQEILAAYPYLEAEDIPAALTYAAGDCKSRKSAWPTHEYPIADRHEFVAAMGCIAQNPSI